ncbi:MAG: MBL fold metallo-hydrolase [Defluviitaleaceae bacterium]|nr:MBL fold metallo-hydrolase [Defluviitaleaceae bacterium]
MRFCPIASGSSGNCVYVGTDKTHLLIDAGLSGKRIEAALGQIDTPSAEKLTGILVTHEHSDHISGVGIMSRRYNLPVYASPNTWRFLLRHGTIGKVDESLRRMIVPGESMTIGDMEVLPFDVPHDASQPVGYCLRGNGYKAVVATDMGYVTDTVRALFRDADVLLLESNHDEEMLENGRYPRALKDRVRGSRGHLSNVAAGALITEVVTDKCQHIFLGHLSEENNRPMIALDTVQRILEANEIQVNRLSVADRHEPSEMVELG